MSGIGAIEELNKKRPPELDAMAGSMGVQNPFGQMPAQAPPAVEKPDYGIFAEKAAQSRPPAPTSGAPIDAMAIMGFERTTPVEKPEEAGKTPEINGTLNAQKPQTQEVKNEDLKAEMEGKKDPTIPTIGEVKDIVEVNSQEQALKAPANTASNAGDKNNTNQLFASNQAMAKDASVATPVADKANPSQMAKSTQPARAEDNSSTGVNPANSSDINPSNINTDNSLQDQSQKLLKLNRFANAQ